MKEITVEEKLSIISEALESRGYDVGVQLTGYLQNGDASYITRCNNARELISTLEKNDIKNYVDTLSTGNVNSENPGK